MSVYFKDKSSTADFVDAVPDKCPICHHKISPQLEIALYSTHDIPCQDIDVVWRCPNHQCNRLFISYYQNKIYQYSTPNIPENIKMDENLSKFSPRFEQIYKQALAAKTYGLSELVGIGFRKALEILIKDFWALGVFALKANF